MAFVNREKELDYLTKLFGTEPNSILILYGPKSCGKTTLLLRLIEQLNKDKYAVNYIDIRKVLIHDFKSFLDVFLPKKFTEKVRDVFSGITLNTGFFSIGIDDAAMLKQNPFKVMDEKLIAAKDRGIQPIIIIDEIQLLKHIYLNGERYLLDELFNFFVATTKVSKSAHVVLATSDSYFVEEIWNSAKLMKTASPFFLDHLAENDVRGWLEKERFSENEIETTYKYLGGSAWEIAELIRKKTAGESVEQVCQNVINQHVSLLMPIFLLDGKSREFEMLYFAITKAIAENGKASMNAFVDREKIIPELIKLMVAKDLWFFEVFSREIVASSKSIEWAMKRLIELKNENIL